MAVNRRVRFLVFERDSYTCQYCGRQAPDVVLHVDHRHPVSRGGTDDMANLVTACKDCNSGKGALILTRTFQYDGGPLDGQEVRRSEKYPVLWAYKFFDGELLYWADEIAADWFEGAGERRVVHGPVIGHRPESDPEIVGYYGGMRERHARQDPTWPDGSYAPKLLGAYVPSWTDNGVLGWIEISDIFEEIEGTVPRRVAP